MAKAVETTEEIQAKRDANANGGFFLKAAVWILARFPFTKNKYQNWTKGRRIMIGWLVWIICLPIIPAVAMIVWYVHDPEGFKKSPYAKVLVAVFIAWAGAFGLVATNPAQLDANGKYSVIQTKPNGEIGTDLAKKPNAAISEAAKARVANQTESKASNGQKFANCTSAFNSGVFNIKRSDPAYANALDGDNDGIACEK
jgi:Excalibur calcium-binding domain